MTTSPQPQQQQLAALRDTLQAIQRGDFTRKVEITGDTAPELAEAAAACNAIVDTLNMLASEYTRIAREVGTDGRFGGQAEIRGIQGTWADVTANFNTMAANLTNQVRDLSQSIHAATQGNTSRLVTCPCSGETRELFDLATRLITAPRSDTTATVP
jgi:HAMP domain-containing protein